MFLREKRRGRREVERWEEGQREWARGMLTKPPRVSARSEITHSGQFFEKIPI